MTRSVPSEVESAVAQDDTRPIYLIRMGWNTELTVCTYGENISWNMETWTASGASVSGLDTARGTLVLPIADDGPWLSLVLNEAPRDRLIEVYEYQTDFAASPQASDAVLTFSGFMDEAVIGKDIRVSLIESSQYKQWPNSSIDRPTYNYLVPSGQRISWGTDYLVAE